MRLRVALVVFALCSVSMGQTCYYPDGKEAAALNPCNTTLPVTNCCKDSDVCLKNGLCFSPGLSSVVRRGCTDQKWNSTECPDVCLTSKLWRQKSAGLIIARLRADICMWKTSGIQLYRYSTDSLRRVRLLLLRSKQRCPSLLRFEQ
jgi:hypothetical protein